MRYRIPFFIAIVFVFVMGCENEPPPEARVAEKIANEFVAALHQQDYELAFTYVSDEFFDIRSREEWEQYFKDVAAILGKNETIRLKSKLNDTKFSGTFFMYEFAGKFENGLAKEMVTMIHKINTGNAPLKIFSYKIDSSKLAKLNHR